MRVAFVLGRYGRSILGGAEALGRGLAEMAASRGWEVEVWSTCAVNSLSWENELPAGETIEDGLTVRRFVVDAWDPAAYNRLNLQMQRYADLVEPQQYDWIASGPHSSALNQHIENEADSFDAIIMMPYLSSIILDAAMLSGDKAVLWPCLHNEIFAYMEPFRLLLESAFGVVFISPEEATFAIEDLMLRIDRSTVIGSGVQLSSEVTNKKPDRKEPYLLYFGRLEHGKNVPMLYEFVRRYVEQGGDLKLVVAGDGPCLPPATSEFDYLGVVSEAEKKRLMTNALAVCQPSYNESFSLVVMESWLASRPALVWSGCEVTRGHVQRSKGGLWFGNYAEFEATINWLKRNEDSATRMGSNGYQYVQDNFTWDQVFSRFENVLIAWQKGKPTKLP